MYNYMFTESKCIHFCVPLPQCVNLYLHKMCTILIFHSIFQAGIHVLITKIKTMLKVPIIMHLELKSTCAAVCNVCTLIFHLKVCREIMFLILQAPLRDFELLRKRYNKDTVNSFHKYLPLPLFLIFPLSPPYPSPPLLYNNYYTAPCAYMASAFWFVCVFFWLW